MKLEVGMYVRTDRGKIGKFRKEVKDYFELEYPKNVCDLIFKNRLKIASHNIIDLIEEGDYVNGHKVILVNNTFTYASVNVETNGEAVCEVIPLKDIKTIVTKEQFEQVSYKVGD